MRYALLSCGGDAPATALESMQIPQAAEAILLEEASYQAFVATKPLPPDWQIRADTKRRLATLTGKDIGPKWQDWLDFCDNGIDRCPTPLSADQASEVNRVVRAINTYWTVKARRRREDHLIFIPEPNFDVPGTAALEQEIEKYRLAADKALER